MQTSVKKLFVYGQYDYLFIKLQHQESFFYQLGYFIYVVVFVIRRTSASQVTTILWDCYTNISEIDQDSFAL